MNPNRRPTRYPSGAQALAASAVIKAGPGLLEQINCYNSSAGTLYLQIFDATAVPADGVTPLDVVQIPSKGNGGLDYRQGKVFTVGICACLSSTDTTKTVAGAVGFFNAGYLT